MDVLKSLIIGALSKQNALKEISEILDDEDSDFDCIEKIVVVLEKIGLNGVCRHDF